MYNGLGLIAVINEPVDELEAQRKHLLGFDLFLILRGLGVFLPDLEIQQIIIGLKQLDY